MSSTKLSGLKNHSLMLSLYNKHYVLLRNMCTTDEKLIVESKS